LILIQHQKQKKDYVNTAPESSKMTYKDNFINDKQSIEQRKVKYWFLRHSGFSAKEAHRKRDWTHAHIVQFMHANKEKIRATYEGEK
jgi:hypothetical protein